MENSSAEMSVKEGRKWKVMQKLAMNYISGARGARGHAVQDKAISIR